MWPHMRIFVSPHATHPFRVRENYLLQPRKGMGGHMVGRETDRQRRVKPHLVVTTSALSDDLSDLWHASPGVLPACCSSGWTPLLALIDANKPAVSPGRPLSAELFGPHLENGRWCLVKKWAKMLGYRKSACVHKLVRCGVLRASLEREGLLGERRADGHRTEDAQGLSAHEGARRDGEGRHVGGLHPVGERLRLLPLCSLRSASMSSRLAVLPKESPTSGRDRVHVLESKR